MTTLQPGQMLGPYQIISQIGQGGMATVYKAFHAQMDRYVAIKILPHQFAKSEEFLARFTQEVKVIARLEHPHILPVYDFGEIDNLPYLIMRYLDSGTLKDCMQSERLPLDRITHIFSQLASALGYAHDQGVIHRDIKSANVLLDNQDNLFLTDFGIAKLVEGTSQLTATGAITGTPAYMSPEQAQGQALDQRSDVYSLGIVLYEMVTGTVPFEAETPLAVLFKLVQDPLPPPSSLQPDLHPAIEKVILKSLAKNPVDRYETSRAFLDAWKVALVESAGKTISSTPSSEGEFLRVPGDTTPPAETNVFPAKQKKNTFPLFLGIITGALVLALVIAGGFFFFSKSRGNGRQNDQELSNFWLLIPPAESIDGWTYWSAANEVLHLSHFGEHLIASSPGGITVWDTSSGEPSRITARNGLPGSSALVSLLDYDDTLWVGTDEGLIHYYGERAFSIYNHEDGLDSEYITAIARLDDNTLLIGSSYSDKIGTGLMIFDGESWKPFEGFPSNTEDSASPSQVSVQITDIEIDQYDDIWVATTQNLARYDYTEWTVFSSDEGLPSTNITDILVDNNNDVWVGSGTYLCRQNEDKFEIIDDLSQREISSVNAMIIDDQNRLWIAGDGGVAAYNIETKDWQSYSSEVAMFDAYDFNALVKDAEGIIYIGSDDHGIFRYDGNSFTNHVIPGMPMFSGISRILPSPGGALWFVELWGSGVTKYSPDTEAWDIVTYEDDYCCPIPYIWDEQERLWAGGDTGLWLIESRVPTQWTEGDGLPSGEINAILPDISKGVVYIGTDSGLYTLDLHTNLISAVSETVDSGEITVLFKDKNSNIWVGGWYQLSRLAPDGIWDHFNSGKPFTENFEFVSDISQDSIGGLWIATYGDGLYLHDGSRWSQFLPENTGQKLPSAFISTIQIGPADEVWVGTQESGAALYDGQDWKRLGSQSGLLHPNITDLYIAEDGTVWFGSQAGITRYQQD
jgi:serine/threonine protein kinase/ligand-binding sensor domain-containing protein